MGNKKPFIKIGRKPKRELNPVEKWRHKIKEKKRVQAFINKMDRRRDDDSGPARKRARSPSPPIRSSDLMMQELITPHSLREDAALRAREKAQKEFDEMMQSQPIAEKPEQEIKKPQQTIQLDSSVEFVPVSIYKKNYEMENIQASECESKSQNENESDEESDADFESLGRSFITDVPRPVQIKPINAPVKRTNVKKDQTFVKNLLEDDKLSEFYKSISDLL
jgi:hypothetical protein